MCDIIQVSAICGDSAFNAYTLPSRAIDERATEVTGFIVSDGGLFCHGVRLHTIPLRDVLMSLIVYLRSFRCPVLLVAHNARHFDAPVLTRVLRQFSLQQEFQQVVSGFLDTLLLSRSLFPGLNSYSQTNLVRRFLRRTYNAHNGEEDARMLQMLFYAWNISEMDICRFTDLPAHF